MAAVSEPTGTLLSLNVLPLRKEGREVLTIEVADAEFLKARGIDDQPSLPDVGLAARGGVPAGLQGL